MIGVVAAISPQPGLVVNDTQVEALRVPLVIIERF